MKRFYFQSCKLIFAIFWTLSHTQELFDEHGNYLLEKINYWLMGNSYEKPETINLM